jgi:hypothetical protein
MKNFIMTIKTEAQDAIEAINKIESHLKGEKDESVHVDIKEEGQEPIVAAPVEPAPQNTPQVGRAPQQVTTHNSWH